MKRYAAWSDGSVEEWPTGAFVLYAEAAAEIERLRGENARLRNLIAHAEWAEADETDSFDDRCPWCNARREDGHAAVCPAFPGAASV